MKPVKQKETQIIDRTAKSKKPKLNPTILKVISLIVVTLIIWLNPEATIVIFLVKLLFILLEWLNQNKA